MSDEAEAIFQARDSKFQFAEYPVEGHVECVRIQKLKRKYSGESMKKSLLAVGVATMLMIAWSLGRMQGQQDQKVIFVSADHANFQETPSKGVSMAAIWGDANKGAHATFTKFVPGFDAGMHTHTSDVWIVVVKGAYLYKDESGAKRAEPGSFLRVPGGMKHWSGGDPKEGALFYEESSGKFDSIPVTKIISSPK
jgi:quercetin dioxygenase-like cupin family protein